MTICIRWEVYYHFPQDILEIDWKEQWNNWQNLFIENKFIEIIKTIKKYQILQKEMREKYVIPKFSKPTK